MHIKNIVIGIHVEPRSRIFPLRPGETGADNHPAGNGRNRLVAAAAALCFLAGLVPLWAVDHFPSVDGPVHVYIVYLLDRLGDGGTIDAVFTGTSVLEPNLAAYGLIWLFMQVAPFAVAEKLFVSTYWLIFAGSSLYLLGALGRRAVVTGLLILPFGLGYYLHWGFYNFILGEAIFLLVAGYALRRIEHLRLPHLLVLSAAMLVLAFCHLVGVVMLLFFVGMTRIGVALRDGLSAPDPLTGMDRWRASLIALLRDGVLITLAALPALALVQSFFLRRVVGDALDAPLLGLEQKIVYIATLSPIFSIDKAEVPALGAYVLVLWTTVGALLFGLWRDPSLRLRALPVLLPPLVLGGAVVGGSLGFAGFDALPRLLPFTFFMLIVALGTMRLGPLWQGAIILAVTSGLLATSAIHIGTYRKINLLYASFAQDRPPLPRGSALLSFNLSEKQQEVAGIPTGWRLDLTDHFAEVHALENDLILLNVDMLSPDIYGYFPVNYRLEARLAAAWRGKLYRPPAFPISAFEKDSGVPVAEVVLWPAQRSEDLGAGSIDEDRKPLLRRELARDFRLSGSAANPAAPLVYRPVGHVVGSRREASRVRCGPPVARPR